ncbi:hypothetical protein IJD44_09565 [bacterium]|nr:hypothetical protein [bacterium]
MFSKFKNIFFSSEIMIIGAGGLGLALAAFLTIAKKNVVTIAKDNQYNRITNQKGINFYSDLLNKKKEVFTNINLKRTNYTKKVDYIFICTRTPDLKSIIPIIEKCAKKDTLIIPVCNGFGVTEFLKTQLPNHNITTGYAYGPFFRNEKDGILGIKQIGTFSGIYLGASTKEDYKKQEKMYKKLENIVKNVPLPIKVYEQNKILNESFKKHCLIAPFEITGLLYKKNMGEILENKEASETMYSLLQDLVTFGERIGVINNNDFYEQVSKDYAFAAPDMRSRAENDINSHSIPEFYFQFFDTLKKAKELNINLPSFEKIAPKLEHLKELCDC